MNADQKTTAPGVTDRPLPRVLLVTKFYRDYGGDCIHVRALERLLRVHGHEVAVMTMEQPDTAVPTEGVRMYTVSPVNPTGPLGDKLRAVPRIFGGGMNRAVKDALDSFRPDVVHLHNVHSYLSPAIARIAHGRGIRVVWTLHDYKLICPAYTMMRRGAVCAECLDSPLSVVRGRCMKGSLAASALSCAEALWWNAGRLARWTDAFICPSEFMRGMMERGGYPPEKLITLPNFLPTAPACGGDERSGVCYIGRLSAEKGLYGLVEAAKKGKWTLVLAGDGPEREGLEKAAEGCGNITFAGRLTPAECAALLVRSRVSVVPSVWYENCPLSVIESLCAGTPVAAAQIGGLPELIDSPMAGRVFRHDSPDALLDAVNELYDSDVDRRRLAVESGVRFSHEAYYKRYLALLAGLEQ